MSCADVQTIQAGDGTKSEFSFDFPYLFKSEVKVYFWNRVTKEYDEIAQDGSGWGQAPANTIYPWEISDANPTIVHFTEIDSGGNTAAVPPSPAAAVDPNEETVDNVKIRRETSIDDIRALFNPGSAIRSDDLNKNFEQLRYAIQEGNCQGITDDVYEYLKDNYWDRYDNTLYEDDAWVSDDTKIATTAALDKRFQDEVAETITSSESWPDNDDTIATTAAIDNRIDTAITNDIGTDGTGITVTDDGDGTITLGLGAGSIDFDRIKDVDIITQAEQDAGSPAAADNNLFTALAAAKRFDTIVQTTTPSGSDWEVGKSWLQNDADKTFSIWDGDSWEGISSGGTFINQPKVVYVDATNGNDDNDGHRISRPKASIKAAINQINADSTYGDGSIVVVAPGVYREAAPIQIQKRDVSVVGTSLRSCVVHPTQATETNTLFEVNSGTYLKNLTFTGVKASGTRGETGSLYTDATYGLPATQGWNVAFLAGATIVKSPYIQNCTNFSDSEIDNTDLNFYSGTEDAGRAGDEDSAMTGGGLLVDGSVPAATSPLRSMVCDSYTHVGLDGPGILVTNNGYAQCTSSYAFFNHFHIACINGGQANLAASTTDFGRFSLITDGRSPNAIFTSNVDGAADDGAISFNINAPTASTDLYNEAGTENDNAWWGSATRPQPNMLVEVNGVTYPILSATANTDSEGGAGWTVTISRPDPNNRSTNLGLNGAITDDAAVSFFLRSMIASSGHTMEYVGSGTNYSALPENGGVPNDSNQIIELNNGKVWTAITDHNGKFRIGGNQTTDPIFEVDQQLGFVTIPEGSIAFNLLSDLTPQLGGNLDANGNDIILDTGAAATPSLTFTGDTNTGLYSPGADQVAISTGGTARLYIAADGDVGIGDSAPSEKLNVAGNIMLEGGDQYLYLTNAGTGNSGIYVRGNTSGSYLRSHTTGIFTWEATGNERMRIDSSGRVGIGTSSPAESLNFGDAAANSGIQFGDGADFTIKRNTSDTTIDFNVGQDLNHFQWKVGGIDYMRLDSSGRLGVGTTSPDVELHVHSTSQNPAVQITRGSVGSEYGYALYGADGATTAALRFFTVENGAGTGEKMRIDSNGRLGIGTSSPSSFNNDMNDLVVGTGSGSRGISIYSGTTSTGNILFHDAANTSISGMVRYDHSNNAMSFWTNGATERMRIDSSGRVGIGTSSPGSFYSGSSQLVVGNTGDQGITIKTGTADVGRLHFADGTTGDEAYRGRVEYLHSSDLMRFGTAGNSSRMVIDSSGNVGIGTTSPSEKLHLADSGAYSKIRIAGNSTTAYTEIYGDNVGNLIFNADPGNSGSSSTIRFTVDGPERARIDSSGRLLVGTSTNRATYCASTTSPQVQIEGTGFDDSSISLTRNVNTTGLPAFFFGKTRGSSVNSNGIVANNDELGSLEFQGNDGSKMVRAAMIRGGVDGTPGTSDMPGRLSFYTTADGASSPTERMRLTKAGNLRIYNATSDDSLYLLSAEGAGTSRNFIQAYYSSSGINGFGTNSFLVRTNGNVQNTNNSYGGISDIKLKENIVDASSQWDDLKAIQVRNYNFKEGQTHTQIGVVAQEVELVSPGLVTESPDKDDEGNDLGTTTKSVNYSVLYMKAVKALQEAMERIETLEAKVAALEAN